MPDSICFSTRFKKSVPIIGGSLERLAQDLRGLLWALLPALFFVGPQRGQTGVNGCWFALKSGVDLVPVAVTGVARRLLELSVNLI